MEKKKRISRLFEFIGKTKKEGNKIVAIVMKANHFILVHLHLVEKAFKENDILCK